MFRTSGWKLVWVFLAAVYAVPVAYYAYGRLKEVTRQARERLIVQHRLWELDAGYQGTPQAWTRFARMLLTDGQLMRRVRARYGELAVEIELDYKRDLAFAHGEVLTAAAAAWALPMGSLYLAGFLVARRRRPAPQPPEASEKPAYEEARYRP